MRDLASRWCLQVTVLMHHQTPDTAPHCSDPVKWTCCKPWKSAVGNFLIGLNVTLTASSKWRRVAPSMAMQRPMTLLCARV